jgi:ornithine cyclodeaminase/alanine dehydrogenase-like protein (mu-crystallin family)
MRILNDTDIDSLPLQPLIAAVRAHIIADAEGQTVAPPRHIVGFGNGDLIFTIGGDQHLAGFRAYQTFAKPGHSGDDQIIVAWDRQTGDMLGLAVGNRLGALRTGCIGAVAVDIMAPKRAKTLAVLGTGRQAETQLRAVSTVREFDEIRVFGRREATLTPFVERLSARLDRKLVATTDARAAVRDAEVVIFATTSTTPVVEAEWIAPGAHVTTIGPKSVGGHELPTALAQRASRIATDSPQQIKVMGADHMLFGSDPYARIEHLGNLATAFDADRDRGLTLFLSIGLAGTEVACLGAALGEQG